MDNRNIERKENQSPNSFIKLEDDFYVDALIAEAIGSARQEYQPPAWIPNMAQNNLTLPIRGLSLPAADPMIPVLPIYQGSPTIDFHEYIAAADAADVDCEDLLPRDTRPTVATPFNETSHSWSVVPVDQPIPVRHQPSGNQRRRVSSNRKAGQLPPDDASIMHRLSYECQRRGFNPQVSYKREGNVYTCNMIIAGQRVFGSKGYTDEQEAKAHTASQVYWLVRQWPLEPPFPMDFDGRDTTTAAIARYVSGQYQNGEFQNEYEEQHRVLYAPKNDGVTITGAKEDKTEKGFAVLSPASGSSVDITDPVQARAYVEGFKMGQLAAMEGRTGPCHKSGGSATASGNRNPRAAPSSTVQRISARSRSPTRKSHGLWEYRDRSRSKEHHRGHFKRHGRGRKGGMMGPVLPSGDSYRPGLQGFSHSGVLKRECDNNYGRLNADDYFD